MNYSSSLKVEDWIAAIIFLGMSYEQLKTNFILANLRKNKDGDVVTKAYKIPTGRLFTFISNPLQFTEILMYAMLLVILRTSSTYPYIFIWVLVNQVRRKIAIFNFPTDFKYLFQTSNLATLSILPKYYNRMYYTRVYTHLILILFPSLFFSVLVRSSLSSMVQEDLYTLSEVS